MWAGLPGAKRWALEEEGGQEGEEVEEKEWYWLL